MYNGEVDKDKLVFKNNDEVDMNSKKGQSWNQPASSSIEDVLKVKKEFDQMGARV